MGYFQEEIPAIWRRWWLVMWGILATGLLTGAFLLPFRVWLVAVILGFGVPEAIGLRKHRDGYPPLTYVTRKFLPRWATMLIVWFCTAASGAYWFGFGHPMRIGALFALLGWANDHFSVTYED